MRSGSFALWRGEVAGVLLMIPVAMTGVALPLGFVHQVDGYLKYLRPTELPIVYAWGWIVFGLIGLALTAATVVPAMGAARLLRQSPIGWARKVGTWVSLMIMVIALLKGTKSWLEVNGSELATWMAQGKLELGVAAAFGCAVWIWHRPALPKGIYGLARFAAIAGSATFVVAALMALFARAPLSTPLTAVAATGQLAKRPNVILLTADALAADHMSLYGYGRPTTPNLERLARQATVFERFYANGNMTTPSVDSIFHGLRPWSHRAIQLSAQIDANIADRNLVARLKEAGYQTFAVVTNGRAMPSHIRVARWLDKVESGRVKIRFSSPDSFALPLLAIDSLQLGILPMLFERMDRLLDLCKLDSVADHHDPEIALSMARHFVEQREAGRPFFLWVHLFPPHDPYATPRPFVGRFDSRPEARTWFDSSLLFSNFEARKDKDFPNRYVGRYDESILYVDHHLGRFADWLKDVGLFDNSLLVVSADHGESFVKGYGGHSGPMLHDALIRVPLILKKPAQRVGQRLDVLAEQIDLMPTILDLVGIPAEGAGEGRSLKLAIQGERITRPVFSMNFEQSDRHGELLTGSVAMIEGRWKYVHYRGQFRYPMLPKLEDSLYDLESDPGEDTNRIRLDSAIAAQMLAQIHAQLRQHGGPVK